MISLLKHFLSYSNLYYDYDMYKNKYIRGAIIPHAGLLYCSEYIGYVMSTIDWSMYDEILLLSTNHYNDRNITVNTTEHGLVPFNGFNNLERNNSEFSREHSWQIILPYIQKINEMYKKNIKIKVILLGNFDVELNKILLGYNYKNTMLIANTDFLHCNGYKYTDKYKDKCINAITFNETNKKILESIQNFSTHNYDANFEFMCGKIPMMYFLNIIKSKKYKILSNKLKIINNNATDLGVGYCGITFGYTKIHPLDIPHIILQYHFEKNVLNTYNKNILTEFKKIYHLPKSENKFGIFVTIYKHGNMIGCVGKLDPANNIGDTIAEYTLLSAFTDSRFHGRHLKDTKSLVIKVNFLTSFHELSSIDELSKHFILGKHGVNIYFEKSNVTSRCAGCNVTFFASAIEEHVTPFSIDLLIDKLKSKWKDTYAINDVPPITKIIIYESYEFVCNDKGKKEFNTYTGTTQIM